MAATSFSSSPVFAAYTALSPPGSRNEIGTKITYCSGSEAPLNFCKTQPPNHRSSGKPSVRNSRVVWNAHFGRGSCSSVARGSSSGAGSGAMETAEGSMLDELDVKSCVREIYSEEEFDQTLAEAAASRALVVVDFFRTACGSCRYIETGYAKLCVVEMTTEREDEAKGLDPHPVIFLKHNVMDEYDERSELADRLKIKVVPMFQFYWDGQLVETFATRDKARVMGAILKHTGRASLGEGGQPEQQQK